MEVCHFLNLMDETFHEFHPQELKTGYEILYGSIEVKSMKHYLGFN